MYYLIYVSSADPGLSESDLQELLENARNKNRRLGISGMLIHRGGNFIQYIEGAEDQVKALYDIICSDKRHSGVIKIADGKIKNRQFGDWAMDLRATGSKPVFSENEMADDPEGVKSILDNFIRNMR